MKTIFDLNTTNLPQISNCAGHPAQSIQADIPQRSTTPDPKRACRFQTLPAIALVLLTHMASAQPWQTVDDFQYTAGVQSENWGLAVAQSGALFACGHGYDALGVGHGLVMASADEGTTWSAPLDDFVYPGSAYTRYEAGIACDSAGNLYVAGRVGFAAPFYPSRDWLVRQGAGGGLSWATVDDFVVSGAHVQPYGLTVDAAANVYVAGVVNYPNGVYAWTVRKGVGGMNFTTVDSFAPGGNGQAQAVFAHPTAGIFAAGFGTVTSKKSGSQAWMVRRSVDSGATWSTVDTYQLASGYLAQANGIGADALGNLYVVGEAYAPFKTGSYANWVVRKSSDGGNTWSTVDNFQPSATLGSTASRFVAGSNGNLFVAGQSPPYGGISSSTWLVRENPGGTGSWTTVDSFQYTSGINEPEAIAADASGHVFVGGWANGPSTSPGPHWVVREN